MRQLEKEKTTSLAWFKLAEVVARGEKERALNMYRLLSHSIANTALRFQLEGDLLLIFHDENAFQCYQKAAQLYKNNNELSQAAMLYDLLSFHAPSIYQYRRELLSAHVQLGNDEKVKTVLAKLIESYCIAYEYDDAIAVVKESRASKECKIKLVEYIISSATQNMQNDYDKRRCNEYINYKESLDLTNG